MMGYAILAVAGCALAAAGMRELLGWGGSATVVGVCAFVLGLVGLSRLEK